MKGLRSEFETVLGIAWGVSSNPLPPTNIPSNGLCIGVGPLNIQYPALVEYRVIPLIFSILYRIEAVIESARRLKQVHAALSSGLISGAPSSSSTTAPSLPLELLNATNIHQNKTSNQSNGHNNTNTATSTPTVASAAANGLNNRFSPRSLNGPQQQQNVQVQQNGTSPLNLVAAHLNGNNNNIPANLLESIQQQQQQRTLLNGGNGRALIGPVLDEVV